MMEMRIKSKVKPSPMVVPCYRRDAGKTKTSRTVRVMGMMPTAVQAGTNLTRMLSPSGGTISP